MRFLPILITLVSLSVPAPLLSQNAAAAKIHRPADGIAGFVEGCVTAHLSTERAEAAFRRHNLALRISSRPQGDFPAGFSQVYGKNAPSYIGKISECSVRIRGLWLSSANPVVAQALKSAGFRQEKALPKTDRRNGMRIENGPAAGLYRHGGRRFLVLVANVRQKAGRLTELSIVEIPTK